MRVWAFFSRKKLLLQNLGFRPATINFPKDQRTKHQLTCSEVGWLFFRNNYQRMKIVMAEDKRRFFSLLTTFINNTISGAGAKARLAGVKK